MRKEREIMNRAFFATSSGHAPLLEKTCNGACENPSALPRPGRFGSTVPHDRTPEHYRRCLHRMGAV